LRRSGRFHSISGHLQLEAPEGGSLHLVTLKWESIPEGSYSLESLVKKIVGNSGIHAHKFMQKLDEFGYRPGEDPEVDNRTFNLLEERCYEVDDTIPRIVSDTFKGGELPAGILRIEYTIDLTNEPPNPLSDPDYQTSVKAFVEGVA